MNQFLSYRQGVEEMFFNVRRVMYPVIPEMVRVSIIQSFTSYWVHRIDHSRRTWHEHTSCARRTGNELRTTSILCTSN